MVIRLLHLSDIHFGGEDAPAVEAATAFAAATPHDLLVMSGDITQYGHHDEFSAAGAWFSSLPGPKLGTPGNHDTPWAGFAERVAAPFARYEAEIGPAPGARFDAPGLMVRAFNSARGWQIRLNWSKGEVGRGQTDEVCAEMAAAPADAVRILVCHHPLIDVEGEPIAPRVRGGRRAARRFAEARADVILSGHLHVPFVEALPFGDRMTHGVGAGTLSLRLRGRPASFNVIEIDGDQMQVEAMAWTGRQLEVERTWRVALRPRSPR